MGLEKLRFITEIQPVKPLARIVATEQLNNYVNVSRQMVSLP